MMSVLSVVPLLLLGLFAVWFLWPVIVDPVTRRFRAANDREEHDQVAEGLFERWSRG